MATFRNTNDLKKDALERAGELTDGTSDFDARAVRYLNDAYQGLFAGGTEFGVDIDEDWIWAKKDRPMILTLQPAYETGTVTVTKGSTEGTFSDAPADSQKDRFLKLEGRDEYFRIREHTGGATSFEIDQGYTEDSGTLNFKSIPLEYELSDDTIVVSEANNQIPFRDTASTKLNAVLANGVYSPSEYAAEAKTKMESVGGQTYTISFDSVTRKFSFASDGATFFLDWASGNSIAQSNSEEVGFDSLDLSGALSYTAQNSLNAIYRVFRPVATYRNIDPNMFFFEGVNVGASNFRNFAQATNIEQGKIFGIDFDTMIRQWPLTTLTQGTPDKFALMDLKENGVARVRFNRFPDKESRVEFEYIPVIQDLHDNTTSTPKIPRAFRPYLVHAAAHYIMLDKSDNRAQTEFNLARAKLFGLIRSSRSTLKQTANNFARLIPRR